MSGFYIEQIKASGKGKTDSVIKFCKGINILHARSDSGKTMAANCIAYAMGGSVIPFLPEITGGYDTVCLVLREYSGYKVEITRIIKEKKVDVISDDPQIKPGQYSLDTDGDKSLNSILLRMIGLDYVPKIGKNADSVKVNLTWKTLMQALYLDKETMGRSTNVIEPENVYSKTMLLSALLYIVYGQDFSEKDPQTKDSIRKAQYEAKLGYVLQKMNDFEKRKQEADSTLKKLAGDGIKNGIDDYESYLSLVENEIAQSIEQSKQYYYEILDMEEQLKGNQFLLERYESLKTQYVSDVKRLNCIVDGEKTFELAPKSDTCPFCQNTLKSEHKETLLNASVVELQRTVGLLNGLERTEEDVAAEIQKLQEGIANIKDAKRNCDEGVDKELKPLAQSLRKIVRSYEESIKAAQDIEIYNQMIAELEFDKCRFEEEEKTDKLESKKSKYKPKEFFKSDLVDALTANAQEILKECHYPKHANASFDLKSFDIQVDGVDKALIHGQGYCSFFNTVLFMIFRKCFYDKAQYKPGLMMVDTPLLGLVERVGEPDPQELKSCLYRYLSVHKDEGQVIILDNSNELPDFLYGDRNITIVEFLNDGRTGFLLDYNNEK